MNIKFNRVQEIIEQTSLLLEFFPIWLMAEKKFIKPLFSKQFQYFLPIIDIVKM